MSVLKYFSEMSFDLQCSEAGVIGEMRLCVYIFNFFLQKVIILLQFCLIGVVLASDMRNQCSIAFYFINIKCVCVNLGNSNTLFNIDIFSILGSLVSVFSYQTQNFVAFFNFFLSRHKLLCSSIAFYCCLLSNFLFLLIKAFLSPSSTFFYLFNFFSRVTSLVQNLFKVILLMEYVVFNCGVLSFQIFE